MNYLKIPVDPPYQKPPETPLNEFGLHKRDYYLTCDVCKVLNIKPDTFRQRIYRGYYPEYQKVGVKRVYTLEQIKDMIRSYKNAVLSGANTNGDSDSVASIAGGISGAYLGIDAIPGKWIKNIEKATYLEELAVRLAAEKGPAG